MIISKRVFNILEILGIVSESKESFIFYARRNYANAITHK